MRTRYLVDLVARWQRLINELAFEHLDGPVKRVGSTFTPVGFNRILEAAISAQYCNVSKKRHLSF